MPVSESHLSQVVGQNPLLEEVTAAPGARVVRASVMEPNVSEISLVRPEALTKTRVRVHTRVEF